MLVHFARGGEDDYWRVEEFKWRGGGEFADVGQQMLSKMRSEPDSAGGWDGGVYLLGE